MKILVLTDGIYPYVIGGMQKHSYNLCRYLSRLGVEIILYHCVNEGDVKPGNLEGFSESELKNIKQKCFYFPKLDNFPGHYLRESYKLSEEYNQSIKQEDGIDLIYAQGFTAWAYLKKRDKLLDDIPVVINFHGLEMFQKAASFKMKMEHLLLRSAVKFNIQHADYVISLGGKLTDIIAKITDSDNIFINSIGIEKDWITETTNENKVRQLVFIGRNERRKGIKELNKVISRITDLKFQLHIIGPFEKVDQINDSRITYYGEIREQDKIANLLEKMDVLVLPSWSEGMPTVILEAMARGCAIVANDVGAVNELVDDNVGWLCQTGNEDSLEEGLRKSIKISTNDLNRLKNNAIKRISESYTWDNVSNNLLYEFDKSVFS